MARKLTFPESVSEVNAERLRKLVMNGPKQHPGANMIEDEITGERTHLETLSYE
jgi:DNA-directed RNA polymerase I subunit RPA1